MNKLNSGIYEIVNIINGHRYIGSAKDLEDRWRRHKCATRKGKHHSIYFQRAWDLYGETSFKFNVLSVYEPDLLLYMEDLFLKKLKPEYNTSIDAVAPMTGKKHTDASKQKIRLALLGNTWGVQNLKDWTGLKRSDETRKKMSKAKLGNKSCVGRIYTKETKYKIGIAMRGKRHSKESRLKISIGHTGLKYNKRKVEQSEVKAEDYKSRNSFRLPTTVWLENNPNSNNFTNNTDPMDWN